MNYDQPQSGQYVTGPAFRDANGAPVAAASSTVSGVAIVVEIALEGQTQLCDNSPAPRMVTLVNVGVVPVYISQVKALTYLPASNTPVGLVVHAGANLVVTTTAGLYAAVPNDCGITGKVGLFL